MANIQENLTNPPDLDAIQREIARRKEEEAALTRPSRIQEESSVDQSAILDEWRQQWERPLSLDYDALPPMQGMVQRMVRIRINGTEDFQNYYEALRDGWRPRLRSTVPKGLYPSLTKLNIDRDYGEVVGTHCSILMERPKRYQDEEYARRDQYHKDMEQLVREAMNDPDIRERGLEVSTSRDNRHTVHYSVPDD